MLWQSLYTASGAPLYSARSPSQISVSASAVSKGWLPVSPGMMRRKASAAGMRLAWVMRLPFSSWYSAILVN